MTRFKIAMVCALGLFVGQTGQSFAQSAKTNSYKNTRPDGYVAPEDVIWHHEKSEAEIEFVKAHLDSLQEKSFRENREYCGYIFEDGKGGYRAGKSREGTESGCGVGLKNTPYKVVASFHTHGAYLSQYENELPSPDDLLNDMVDGLDGYISTPGGRVWFTDASRDAALLICDEGCVTMDKNYVRDESRKIKERYTLREIRWATR